MITNGKMIAGRFLRWHRARVRINWILQHLEAGRTVQIATYLRATRYTKQHAAMFKASRNGAFVRCGSAWDCIDGCDIRSFP